MVVTPPHAAAAVPDSKSSAVRVPPRSRSRWVWTSTPPGNTWSPRASISVAPGSRPSAMLAMRPCRIPRSATKVSVAVTISPPRITRSCAMTSPPPVSGRGGRAFREAPRDRAARCPPVQHQLRATPDTCFWGFFDSSRPPVLEVRSGDLVRVETLTHQAGDAPDLLMDAGVEAVYRGIPRAERGPGVHIMTGPIRVAEAEPGDTLEV